MYCLKILQERGSNEAPDVEERSYYIDYILRDLEPWRKHGITEVHLGNGQKHQTQLISEAQQLNALCRARVLVAAVHLWTRL